MLAHLKTRAECAGKIWKLINHTCNTNSSQSTTITIVIITSIITIIINSITTIIINSNSIINSITSINIGIINSIYASPPSSSLHHQQCYTQSTHMSKCTHVHAIFKTFLVHILTNAIFKLIRDAPTVQPASGAGWDWERDVRPD